MAERGLGRGRGTSNKKEMQGENIYPTSEKESFSNLKRKEFEIDGEKKRKI